MGWWCLFKFSPTNSVKESKCLEIWKQQIHSGSHKFHIFLIWSINCVDVIYRMRELPCSEFPNSPLQQPSTLNFQYSKRLQNPFPLNWLPCKRAAKLTVFPESGFRKIMRIWLAAPKHSRCIHDTLHLRCKDCKVHFLWFDYPAKEQQS